MKPLIDPNFFYYIDIYESIRFVIVTAFILSIGYPVIKCVVAFIDGIDREDSFQKSALRTAKNMLFFIIPMAIILIFLPSQKTLIRMELAKHLTKKNIEYIGSVISPVENKSKK